jgi:CRISPR-associated protein Csb1
MSDLTKSNKGNWFDDIVKDRRRILLDVALTPLQGDRFQPTGFADLGAAIYTLPDGTRKILVESVQSMANRLEAALLEDRDLKPAFRGLSYVRVFADGEPQMFTNSLIEPHRLNSPWILGGTIKGTKVFLADTLSTTMGCAKRGGKKKAKKGEEAEGNEPKPVLMDQKRIANAIFRYDANALLHGLFLVGIENRIRTPRALTAFIEATNVREAHSGGVKSDPLQLSRNWVAQRTESTDVYGNVIFHRIEYTAERITAFFNLDLDLLRGFGLPECAFNLLVNLAFYKIRFFLENGLRLRTACDLRMTEEIAVREPKGLVIPDLTVLEQNVVEKINE